MKSLLLAFATLTLVVACGGSSGSDGNPSSSGGGLHDNNNLPPGDVARGRTITVQQSCPECHGGDFSGSSFFANVTPDPTTGIGNWTDAQIAAALRDGKDIDGTTLCGEMERFPFSDQETADVIAFLRSLTPISKAITAECPGHGG